MLYLIVLVPILLEPRLLVSSYEASQPTVDFLDAGEGDGPNLSGGETDTHISDMLMRICQFSEICYSMRICYPNEQAYICTCCIC
jgi:hypothetical protein